MHTEDLLLHVPHPHALRAGAEHVDAQVYRAELWRSIKRARGFDGGFVSWWPGRPSQLSGAPRTLPSQVPTLSEIEIIFRDFDINYKRFESWHARQRSSLLQAHLQHQEHRVFSLVKPTGKAPLSWVEHRSETEVLAVSEDQRQLHVTTSLPSVDYYTFTASDCPLSVASVDGPVWTLPEPTSLEPGDAIELTRHYITVPDIFEALEHFWRSRWWKDSAPSGSDWDRIFRFAEVYLPRRPQAYRPLTMQQWTSTVNRYKESAARGPDGISHYDLKWMPPAYQTDLLLHISAWESHSVFPESMRTGFIHPLPKKDDSAQISEFRPVIIYSILYRAWSSIRATEFLSCLGDTYGPGQFGFLPQREATEMWMMTQAFLELSILQQAPCCGFITDLQKAFESLPRLPVLRLLQRLGMADQVLSLWSHFLTCMQRRFRLGQAVGAPLGSNYGMPEGCALSCIAMVAANLSFHTYMRAFTSRTTPLSYVDNLEILCDTPATLATSIACMEAWTEMWGLALDQRKSVVWASDPAARGELQVLGWPVVTHICDLGAPLTLGKRHSVVDATARLDSLAPLWIKLSRLRVSQHLLWKVVVQAFWPRAFYGISICRLGTQHIASLRTRTMKALRYHRAGANAGIRLALFGPMQLDPGFYQFWSTLRTFRRVALKQPGLLIMWTRFMQSYRGGDSQGPFGKLLELYVHQLDGVDLDLLERVLQRLPLHQRAILGPLQDGTFLEPAQQHRFDLSRNLQCLLCGAQDSLSHRCTACPGRRDIYADHVEVGQHWPTLPDSLRFRLLPSRNHAAVHLKRLRAGRAAVEYYTPVQRLHESVDLFTDGSCRDGQLPHLAAGAYAVVDATHDYVLLRGACGGMCHSSDAAELCAVLAALRHLRAAGLHGTLWIDNAYVAEGLILLLDDLNCEFSKHLGLWQEIRSELRARDFDLRIQHVSSHKPVRFPLQDPEEWIAYWNMRADLAANDAHCLHPAEEELLRQRALLYHHGQAHLLRRLASFHVALAERYTATVQHSAHQDEIDTDEPSVPDRTFLGPLTWQELLAPLPDLRAMILATRFGSQFSEAMLTWLRGTATAQDVVPWQLSFVELALWILTGLDCPTPRPHPSQRLHWVAPTVLPHCQVQRPTVASAVALAKAFVKEAVASFELDIPMVNGLNLCHLGVTTPLSGIALKLSRRELQHISAALTRFTATRPVKRVNDLTRPVG
eukprot:Skav202659  [mRNA]  locus=scaffold1791:149925:153709:- [translate_table: standard]